MSAAEMPTAPSLAQVRAEIEAVDDAIVDALARRMTLVHRVRAVKQRAGQPVCDPAREAAVVARVSARARTMGLPEEEVRGLYWRIMAMARREQIGGN